MITVRIPFKNTEPFQINNIVKQGTVLGPVLNNCSLDDSCAEGQGYIMGTVVIKAVEFDDDMADLNSASEVAANTQGRGDNLNILTGVFHFLDFNDNLL